MNFNADIQMFIYQFIPTITKKYCNKCAYQNYLKLFLPKSSDEWNIELYLKKNDSDMIEFAY